MNFSMSAEQPSHSVEAERSNNLVSFPIALHLHSISESLAVQQGILEAMHHFWEQLAQMVAANHANPLEALRQVPALIGSMLRVDACWILIHEVGHQKNVVAHWQAEMGSSRLQDQAEAESCLGLWKSLRRRGAIVLTDIQSPNPATAPLMLERLNWLSAVTTREQQQAVRAVAAIALPPQALYRTSILVSRSQAQEWQSFELELIQSLAQPLALLLSQVQLQQHLERRTQHQQLLSRLAQSLSHTSELEAALSWALSELAQSLRVSQGFILLLRYAQPLLPQEKATTIPDARVEVVCSWAHPQALSPPQSHPTPRSRQKAQTRDMSLTVAQCAILSQALQSAPLSLTMDGMRLSVRHTQTGGTEPCHRHSRLSRQVSLESDSAIAPLFQPQVFPALLMVPIEKQDKVLGFIVLQDQRPRFWDADECALVELAAVHLGNAILHHQTLQQVQSLVTERTLQLQRSLEVQSKLYEQTRKQIDQLRHLNQLKDEFLSTVSHELLTPLTSMRLATQMLRQSNLSPERQHTYLNILEEQCNQEIALINDLLALRQLESKSMRLQLQNLDLGSALQTWTQAWSGLWTEKNLSFHLDLPARFSAAETLPSLPLQTDPDSLQRVLYELMTNASKYAHPNSAVHLQVGLSEPHPDEERQIVIRLSNQGAGIAPEDLPHVFDKFRRGRNATAQAIQGTGLGLTLVKHLVRHLQGSITVMSHPLDEPDLWETCFTLCLPQFRDSEMD